MTPLSAIPAPAPKAAVAPPAPNAAQAANPRPTFEAVRQNVEATKAKAKIEDTSEAPVSETGVVEAMPSAPLLPAVPPVAVPLPLPVLADLAPVSAAPAKAIGAAASGSASASIFFQDAETHAPDAADFAADLLAALTSTNSTAALITDAKAAVPTDLKALAPELPKLDMTSDAWLDQLARDITATANTEGKLSFRIVPPQLGQLDINIETRDAGVAIHMKAETREAQAIIASAQPRLENTLGQNGIRVAETSVTSNGQDNLPKPHFIPQNALIEAVNELEPEAEVRTAGRAAGRFA